MKLLLLLLIIISIIPLCTTLSCGWLINKYSFYNGQCCNQESVDWLNQNYGNAWRTSTNYSPLVVALSDNGICQGVPTTTVKTTTPRTTTTTEVKQTTTTKQTTTKPSELESG
ncbi:hypothetical protein CAEBREN_28094 [Caenorhabditis brenneri]|uniref:Uncharacterized protein n=1 Tax=Caenorhabditis brenneri TaxID=135651 RepID=G0NNY6_CAEBE|nr:hypothetical protein CAEBREN_28094 [Caenorhabditis brenneri]